MPWLYSNTNFDDIINEINNDNAKWCDYLNMFINDIDEEYQSSCPNSMECEECEYRQTVLNR